MAFAWLLVNFGEWLVLIWYSIVARNNKLACDSKAMLPLLFSGVVVAGVAFTFQVLGQRGTNPTLAALIMSLEAVFAVIGGILFLNERMSPREWLGSGLMLIALIIAQVRFQNKSKVTTFSTNEINNKT